jgi:hypothetical protein
VIFESPFTIIVRNTCQKVTTFVKFIEEALKKWKIEELLGNKYIFLDIDDPDLSTILKAFGIFIPKRLFSKKELREVGVTCELVK